MKVNMLLFVVATAVMGFKFVLMTKLTGSLYMAMGDANEDEMNAMLEEVGELQERLDSNG